jgi:7-cyano-7-deazaguanine reductase
VKNQKKNKKYAALTLLGNSQATFPKSPQQATLEAFPNPNVQRDFSIRIDCPDFTSLCPVTGQPDFAEIFVEYVPDARCLETKSLKLYLASYRNVHAFNETVINRILDDLVGACHPRHMRVEGNFAARGGLALTVVAEHPQKTEGFTQPAQRGKKS